jgi:hypothetical protein
MSNISRGWVFDLVNSIANDLAIVNHLTESIYAAQKDADDGITDNSDYKKILDIALANRRDKMNLLVEVADKYNKRMWCPLKHAIESYMESMEVWQAYENESTYNQMIKSTDVLAGCLSLFLGMELTTCGRCLSDQLSVSDGGGKITKIKKNDKKL